MEFCRDQKRNSETHPSHQKSQARQIIPYQQPSKPVSYKIRVKEAEK